ncbi:MAG: hypothetical protein J1E83_12590 [Lachnospiraceae bacterium]|nr:hypothetical protein [Lachnospiraceae bacterium]
MKEDGAYVTYTPPGGADAVSKKLGSYDFSALKEEVIVEYPALYSGPHIMSSYELDFTDVIYFDIGIDPNSNTSYHYPFGYIVVPGDDHHYGYGGPTCGRGNGIVLNANGLTGQQTITINNMSGSAQRLAYIKAYKCT